jgi:zinc protease
MNRIAPGLLALAALLALSAAGRADTPAAPQKVATVEGITEYRLANGARVLLYPDPTSSTVTVNLTVLVGSRHEGYGETGMAHLLEHMVFKGTPTHGNVPKALRDHGANFNGTTNTDRTNYFETMPATDENLEFGIRLEADRLVNSFVKREDLVSEMTVVRNEFESGENSPQRVLQQRIAAAAYEWHNYGKSTIGNRSDIERVPIENLQAFYRKYYQPDNVVLIVVGKFEEPRALELVQKYLGAIPRPKRKLDDTYTEEPPQDGERIVTLRRVGKVGVVGVAYHVPAAAHPDHAAMQVLSSVLTSFGGGGGGRGPRGGGGGFGGGGSGRLYDLLVASGKATSVRCSAQAQHDPGLFEATAQCEPDKLDTVRTALVTALEQLTDKPVTAEEVDRAKVRFQRMNEMMATRSEFMHMRLSEAAAQGDWRLLFVSRDRLQQVTPDDVNRVARQYIVRSNRTVGVYVPADTALRAAVPPTPALDAIVRDYKGKEALAQGEAFDYAPANVEARTRRGELPGVPVKTALLPKKNRGETVSAELVLHFGDEQSLAGQRVAAELLGALLMRGTRQHDRRQLQDEMTRLGVQVGVNTDAGRLTATVTGKRANLPAALKLLGEVLREPAFPADEFEVMKRARRDGLESSRTDPAALARETLQRKLNPYPPGDVRYSPTIEEQLAEVNAVTLAQVRELYQTQLGVQRGELVVVGDFDPEATVRQVADLLRGWEAKVPYRRIERRAGDGKGERLVIETPDKANATYLAGLALALTDRDPDYPALVVGNFIFGGGTLSSRLGDRVRQKEGLSYGVRSSFSVPDLDPSARFDMSAICNPVNIDRVDKAIAEELARFLSDGVTETELAEAKKAYLESRKVSRSSDQAVLRELADGLFTGRTPTFFAEQEQKIRDLTPEQVREAFRKHVTPEKLVIIRAGDFQKKAAAGTGGN